VPTFIYAKGIKIIFRA